MESAAPTASRLKERVDRFKVRSLGAGGIAAVKGQLGHILVQRHVTDVVIIIRDVQTVMIHLHKALPQHFGDRFAGQLYDTISSFSNRFFISFLLFQRFPNRGKKLLLDHALSSFHIL